MSPLPVEMTDPTFLADATAGFDETPARGPYTLAMRNSAIYIPLANMSADFEPIIATIKQQLATSPSDNGALYLAPDINTSPALIAGYQHQLALLLSLHSNATSPSLEVPFGSGTSLSTINLHPFSRGTVRLNTTHPLEQPVLDYRSGSNPLDIAVTVAHLRYLRQIFSTATMRARGAVEVAPGAAVATTEQLEEYARSSIQLSVQHPCCTAAMLPREMGGVVGKDLRVHGADGLRIVDMSTSLLLLASHLSSLAYAIAEKVRLPLNVVAYICMVFRTNGSLRRWRISSFMNMLVQAVGYRSGCTQAHIDKAPSFNMMQLTIGCTEVDR